MMRSPTAWVRRQTARRAAGRCWTIKPPPRTTSSLRQITSWTTALGE